MSVLAFQTGAKFNGFSGGSLVILVAAGIAACCWLAVFAIRWMASFPKLPAAGPETSELGPEPPAVVNMLVSRWQVTRLAVPATLVDLAARGVVGLEEDAPEEYIVRLRPTHENVALTPYEQMVLDAVKARATGGSAPVQALDTGSELMAAVWWKRFSKSVAADAKARGLSRARWSSLDWVILAGGFALVLALVALAFGVAHLGEGLTSSRDGNKTGRWDWFAVAFFVWLIGVMMMSSMRSIRDTRAGRDVCARWLGVRRFLRNDGTFGDAPPPAVTVWGRNLSYGVALGVARATAMALPLGDEDPNSAWSRYGGSWHQVRVEYPKRFGYGSTPLGVFLGGLVRTVFWGAITFAVMPTVIVALWRVQSDVFTHNTSREAILFVALFVAVFGVIGIYLVTQLLDGLIRLGYGALDLGRHVERRGAVVRVGQSGDHSSYIAIDDGHAPETKAFRPPVNATIPRRGDEVSVTMSPHLHHVTHLEIVHSISLEEHATSEAGGAPAVASAMLDTAAVSRIVGRPVSAVAPDQHMTAGFPPGATINTFSDGAQGRIAVMRVAELPAGLAMIEHRIKGEPVPVGTTGLTGRWVRDRALIVDTPPGAAMVVVQLPDREPADCRAIAVDLAALVLAAPAPAPNSAP